MLVCVCACLCVPVNFCIFVRSMFVFLDSSESICACILLVSTNDTSCGFMHNISCPCSFQRRCPFRGPCLLKRLWFPLCWRVVCLLLPCIFIKPGDIFSKGKRSHWIVDRRICTRIVLYRKRSLIWYDGIMEDWTNHNVEKFCREFCNTISWTNEYRNLNVLFWFTKWQD